RLYRAVAAAARQPFELAARHLDVIHEVGGALHVAAQLEQRRHLRLDVRLGAARMRILDNGERLGELPPGERELDSVGSRRRQNRELANIGRAPATAHVWGAGGAQRTG